MKALKVGAHGRVKDETCIRRVKAKQKGVTASPALQFGGGRVAYVREKMGLLQTKQTLLSRLSFCVLAYVPRSVPFDRSGRTGGERLPEVVQLEIALRGTQASGRAQLLPDLSVQESLLPADGGGVSGRRRGYAQLVRGGLWRRGPRRADGQRRAAPLGGCGRVGGGSIAAAASQLLVVVRGR